MRRYYDKKWETLQVFLHSKCLNQHFHQSTTKIKFGSNQTKHTWELQGSPCPSSSPSPPPAPPTFRGSWSWDMVWFKNSKTAFRGNFGHCGFKGVGDGLGVSWNTLMCLIWLEPNLVLFANSSNCCSRYFDCMKIWRISYFLSTWRKEEII